MEVMKEYGLVRGENELELYLMAEIPSNILMAEQCILMVFLLEVMI
jgi:pyruvate,water dikinase